MYTLGIAMIIGGLAFLVSGLIFLLPVGRKFFSSTELVEETQKRFEHYLQQVRERTLAAG